MITLLIVIKVLFQVVHTNPHIFDAENDDVDTDDSFDFWEEFNVDWVSLITIFCLVHLSLIIRRLSEF